MPKRTKSPASTLRFLYVVPTESGHYEPKYQRDLPVFQHLAGGEFASVTQSKLDDMKSLSKTHNYRIMVHQRETMK